MPFNNYSPSYVFKGAVSSENTPSEDNHLVRKQDVAGLSFISSVDSDYFSVVNGGLTASNLLISDVEVNTTDSSLANFVSNSASSANLGVGDVVILTSPTPSEMYIVKSNDGTSADDYQEIQSGLTQGEILSHISAGTGIAISNAGVISSTITQYADSDARSALSAGSGISYNSSTGQISSSITQYSDSDARSALSAGTGLTYNSSTGEFACSITQYTDANARAALSAGTGLTYNSSTGEFASSITQYTDANARAAFSAGTGITISVSGEIATSITQYTDANARAAVSVGDGLDYNSSTGVFDLATAQGLDFSSGNLEIANGDGLDFALNGDLEIDDDYFRKQFSSQSLSTSGTSLTHNLGKKYVHVSIYDSNDALVHADVSLTDANSLSITVSDALTNCTVIVSI